MMNELISKFYPPGGTVIRAMAAKLLAGGIINPHTDRHPSFHIGHRIHIPITTNPRVRFMIDGRPYQFKVGEAYEINNQMMHSVMNKGDEDRITFIFDYVPPDQIAQLSRLAAEFELEVSVGSDFHRDGPYWPDLGVELPRLGDLRGVWERWRHADNCEVQS